MADQAAPVSDCWPPRHGGSTGKLHLRAPWAYLVTGGGMEPDGAVKRQKKWPKGKQFLAYIGVSNRHIYRSMRQCILFAGQGHDAGSEV
jgi:hypothetical protein